MKPRNFWLKHIADFLLLGVLYMLAYACTFLAVAYDGGLFTALTPHFVAGAAWVDCRKWIFKADK